MKAFYLPFLISLCIITTSENLISQEDPFIELANDTSDFILNQVMKDNAICRSYLMQTFLQNTQLGITASEFFKIIFEIDLMDAARQGLPNLIRRIFLYISPEDIQEAIEWSNNLTSSITQEEIDHMKQELEDLKTEWNFCLENPELFIR